MITGIVVFLCILSCVAMILLGYIIGVKITIDKLGEASIDAMFDCGIDSATVERVIEKTKAYLKNQKN